MKKWFVTSDIHGFYNEFINGLNKAGFDIDNPEHILIICGDIFDRGPDPLGVYNFLRSLPKDRRILIRGNHEYLLNDLVKRKYAYSSDEHNGTLDTLYKINGYKDSFWHLKNLELFKKGIHIGTPEFDKIMDKWQVEYLKLYTSRKIKKILNWINSDEWVNYYELGNYIFVHSFIPLDHGEDTEDTKYRSDWRNANQVDWKDATWGCPWKYFKDGLFHEEIKNNKVLVCGHWHASDFYNNLIYENNSDKWLDLMKDNPIFTSKNLIALDACTAATKGINVLVIDEDMTIKTYNHNN